MKYLRSAVGTFASAKAFAADGRSTVPIFPPWLARLSSLRDATNSFMLDAGGLCALSDAKKLYSRSGS